MRWKTGFLLVIIKESLKIQPKKKNQTKPNENVRKLFETNAYRLPLLTAHYSSFISTWLSFRCWFWQHIYLATTFFDLVRKMPGNGIELCLSKLKEEDKRNIIFLAPENTIWETLSEMPTRSNVYKLMGKLKNESSRQKIELWKMK